MPKNKGKGGKNRKNEKNEGEDDKKRELVLKEEGQEYAQVKQTLRNGWCEAMYIDGTKRLCHIRGKMQKKVWIAAGDDVLVGLREYQDDKADVIHKYMADETRSLQKLGQLPASILVGVNAVAVEDDLVCRACHGCLDFDDEDFDGI